VACWGAGGGILDVGVVVRDVVDLVEADSAREFVLGEDAGFLPASLTVIADSRALIFSALNWVSL
jgi:hypothetical protein